MDNNNPVTLDKNGLDALLEELITRIGKNFATSMDFAKLEKENKTLKHKITELEERVFELERQ